MIEQVDDGVCENCRSGCGWCGRTVRVPYLKVLKSIVVEMERISLLPRERVGALPQASKLAIFDDAWGAAAHGSLGLYASRGVLRLLAALRAFDGEKEFVFVAHPADDNLALIREETGGES